MNIQTKKKILPLIIPFFRLGCFSVPKRYLLLMSGISFFMWLANANINKLSWYSLSLLSEYQLSFLIYAFASQIKSEFPDINNKYRLSTETHQGLKKELIFKIRVFKSRSTISVPLDLHGWYKLPKFKKRLKYTNKYKYNLFKTPSKCNRNNVENDLIGSKNVEKS